MILRRDGASRRDDVLPLPRSVPELGRALRRERTRQGLRVEEVAARTGLPQALLESLEAGTVDRLPDRVQTIKTLRGYADALGLPGDRYALVLIDLWPGYGGMLPPVAVVQGTPGATATGAALTGVTGISGLAANGHPSTPVPAVGAPHETGVVPTNHAAEPTAPPSDTGPVRHVGGTSEPAPGTAQVPMVLADTGVTPAVAAAAAARRHRRSPLWLRVVVGVVVAALLIGVAGLVVHGVQPQWLRDIGITSSGSGSGHAGGGTHHPPSSHEAAFAMTSSSSTTANFNIRAPSFEVKVVATGSPAWIQATDPQHIAPLFAGVIPAGQSKLFVVQKSLTLETGATAARVFVAAGLKPLGFYFPQAAPFTLVFHRVS